MWLNQPDSAMMYAREAIVASNHSDNVRDKAIAVRMVGAVFYYQGSYDSAIKYGHEAYELSKLANDNDLMASALNNIGLASYYLGSYPYALETLLRSLNLKNKSANVYGLATTYNNLGLVYAKLKKYPKSREYFIKAKSVAISEKNKNSILYSLNNLASTFFDEGNFSESQKVYEQALEEANQVDNINWHAETYIGLGKVNLKLGKINQADQFFRVALTMKKKIIEKNGVSQVYYFLGKIKSKQNRLDSATIFLKMSEHWASLTGSRDRELENLALQKDIYTQKRKFDSALFFQSKYLELRDSLFNETTARNLGDIQLKIQEEEAKQQLADKDLQLERKTNITYFLIGGIALVMIFLFIVFRFYYSQKRLSAALENQKEEIRAQKESLALSHEQLEKAHTQINKQNAKLSEMNEQLLTTVDSRTKELELANKEIRMVSLELDNFIYKSSHDIKGPLSRLIGICHVAMLDVEDEKSHHYFSMLKQTAQLLNDIFNKLKTVSDINSKSVEHLPVNFDSIFSHVKSQLKTMEGYDEINITSDFISPVEYNSDPYLLEIIFHNMMENAIRFQKKSDTSDKFINIKVTKEKTNLVLTFIDNGIGISQSDVDHIFKMFSQAALQHHTVGLGLYIVKQCVSKLNGSINLVRNDQKNTEFEIVLA
ncbi:MAG: tetratricopeptide repeat-containing sensor histidine kinase [Cyclobacteriaceae bacterium]